MYSARLVALLPVTATVLPVVVLSVTSFESVDHVIPVSRARMGETLAVSVAPSPPVRMDGDAERLTNGPAPASAGAAVRLAMAMRKTSLPSASYLARTPAGSQSSAGPFTGARSRFHGLKA